MGTLQFNNCLEVQVLNSTPDQVRFLLNRVNKRLYGNAYTRHGVKLETCVVYHRPTKSHLVYIETPTDRISRDELTDLIKQTQSKTDIKTIDITDMGEIRVLDISALGRDFMLVE